MIAQVAVDGLPFLFVLDRLFEPDRRSPAELALIALAAGTILTTVSTMFQELRGPLVRSSLRAYAAVNAGSLEFEVRGTELTRLGRLAWVVVATVLLLSVIAAATSGDSMQAVPAALALMVAAVLVVTVHEEREPPPLLAGSRYDRLMVSHAGLEWRVDGGRPTTVRWTEVIRVSSSDGIVRSGNAIRAPSSRSLPGSALRYREPSSGEEVDLIAIVQAVRPDFVRRRRLRLGRIETALMPAGPNAW